ncbi:uncharacterized protein DSM5745_05807 [Aspergillus mulundensis]|uniref:Class E vacuolar protein-sorting machinery protein HSE1 n=1 Tax=Aspergillus mulundensis TaxID=1810919 RepID=A0A3D8RY49_9EURO|nr:hypothetical protein DSM5745_05807 [Aspergillus mulundensis]RDW78955.1 hypothetical protein DSM5745_05807 [Aspergillus mulundensis]
MDGVDQEEPIFDLATECEGLYASRISILNDAGDQNAAKVVSDLYQRFGAWAAFLGVFAESNVCLDRRLQRHVEIQDQVLRLLDIMISNLTYLFEGSGSTENDTENVFGTEILQQSTSVDLQCLDAISGALDRLNQIGTAIRRSSVTSQTTKARIFAETFDFRSFDQVACLCLRALYPDTSDSLVDHLSRSMTETYGLFLHRKSRKARLELPRASPHAKGVLNVISEEHPGTVDADSMDIDLEAPSVSVELSNNNHLAPPNQVRRPPQSQPTSVDTKELKTRLRKLLGPPSSNKPLSILANQVKYPRPAKESLTCEWCFSPLTADTLEKLKWQQHINEDFKPYICLSEKCPNGTPRFASSHEWFQHMSSTHSSSWHCEIHASSSWACPLCSEDTTFSTSEALARHLEGWHDGIFKAHQVNSIVRQSIFPVTRPKSTCPLCCFPMGDDQSHNGRMAEEDSLAATSVAKRLRTEAGYTGMNSSEVDAETPPVHARTVASHVAAHLQNVMLLALRLISIQGAQGVYCEHQSNSSDTDYPASWISSDQRDLDGDKLDTDSEDDGPAHADDCLDNNELPTPEHIPDSLPMDWTDILPSIVPGVSADELATIDPPESGKRTLPSSGNEDEIRYHLSGRQEIIKKLLHSEFAFGIDMTVLAEFYKASAMARSCPDLSPEDITIIFRGSSQLLDFSVDFQEQLADAAKSVYVRPASERWPRRPATESEPQSTNDDESAISTASFVDTDRSTFIGAAFLTNVARLKRVYTEYLHSRAAADKRLRTVEKRSEVAKWVKQCDENASQQGYREGFLSLLRRPMKHLVNYSQVLDNLLSATPTDHPDQKALLEAVQEVKALLNAVSTIGEEHGASRSESISRPGILKALNWRIRKPSVAALEPDIEFTLLARRFSDNIPRIQSFKDQVQFISATNPFAEIIDAMVGLGVITGVSPFPNRSSPIQSLSRTIMKSVEAVYSVHRDMLKSRVVHPLAGLLELHQGPRNAIESRANFLPQYTEFTTLKRQGKRTGRRITEQAEKFMALDETLKAKLPRLQFLTAQALQLCLTRFTQIQASLLLEMRKTLESCVGPSQGDFETIVRGWEARDRLPENQVQSLAICNGSLLPWFPNLLDRAPSTQERPPLADYATVTDSSAAPPVLPEVPAPTRVLPLPPDPTKPSYPKPAHASVMFVRALYDYTADDDMTLSFREGDIIQVLHTVDTGWWDGALNNVRGWFPSNYCSVIPPPPESEDQNEDNPYANPNDGEDFNEAPRLYRHPADTGHSLQIPPYARTDPPSDEEAGSWIPQATPDGRLYYIPRPELHEVIEVYLPDVGVERAMRVLWRAASLYEFGQGGRQGFRDYPYLNYAPGEIFDVVYEKGDLWLGCRQSDPTKELGWIWSNHFAKIP